MVLLYGMFQAFIAFHSSSSSSISPSHYYTGHHHSIGLILQKISVSQMVCRETTALREVKIKVRHENSIKYKNDNLNITIITNFSSK